MRCGAVRGPEGAGIERETDAFLGTSVIVLACSSVRLRLRSVRVRARDAGSCLPACPAVPSASIALLCACVFPHFYACAQCRRAPEHNKARPKRDTLVTSRCMLPCTLVQA